MIISQRQRQWIKSCNPNSGVLVFCGVYAVIAAVLLIWATSVNDVKGAVVLMQLALAPFMIFTTVLHLDGFIADMPWLNNPYAGFVASLLVSYFVSHLICWTLIVLASFEAMRMPEES